MPKIISKVVVVGTSAGGLTALKELIIQLPKDFPLPVLIVRHISADATGNSVFLKRPFVQPRNRLLSLIIYSGSINAALKRSYRPVL